MRKKKLDNSNTTQNLVLIHGVRARGGRIQSHWSLLVAVTSTGQSKRVAPKNILLVVIIEFPIVHPVKHADWEDAPSNMETADVKLPENLEDHEEKSASIRVAPKNM